MNMPERKLLDGSQFGAWEKDIRKKLLEKRQKRKRRNLCVVLIFLAVFNVLAFFVSGTVNASTSGDTDYLQDLNNGVLDQLDMIDMSGFETALQELDSSQQDLFNGTSFIEKIKSVLNGDFSEGADTFLKAFFNLFFSEFASALPLIAGIAVIAILCGIISQIRPSFLSNSTGEIVFFASFAVIVVMALVCIMGLINSTAETVLSMRSQMNAAFPVLLTLIAGMGGAVSVKVYQPAIALLAGGVVEIVTQILLPMYIFTLVFSVVGNLSKNVKLTQLTGFFRSTSLIILTVTFTIFTAFLSVQGLTAGTFDGVSIRAAKFATKNYIPILGGYLADGFDLILASAVLIKNSVGAAALVLLFATILMPILQILVVSIGFRLTAAIIEPITDKRITDFVGGIGKNLTMLIVIILAVAFMYLIAVMLLIFTSNAFW